MNKPDERNMRISLVYLEPSATNPRVVNLDDLAELRESIKAEGVLLPLLVRETAVMRGVSPVYEIVDGERRFRAAEAEGIKELPCIVRTMTDAEVARAQVVSTLREGLTPLAEARAFKRLLEELGQNLDELAAAVGKPVKHVLGRFKLLTLAPEVQAAVDEGTLGVSFAVEFLRVAKHADQVKLLADFEKGAWLAQSVTQLREHITDKLLLQIKEAPFNVKAEFKLDEDRTLPACGACPKRTGAQEGLFGDADAGDTCLDGECWAQKCKLTEAKAVEAAKAKGVIVLTGSKAKKVLSGMAHYDKTYLAASDKVQSVKDSPKASELAKTHDIEPVSVYDPEAGKVVQAYAKADLLAKVPAKQLVGGGSQSRADMKHETPEQKAARERKDKLNGLTEDWAERITLAKVRDAAELDAELLKGLANIALGAHYSNNVTLLAELCSIPVTGEQFEVKEQVEAWIDKAKKPDDLVPFLAVSTALRHLRDDDLESVMKFYKVDAKAVLKQAASEAEAEIKEEDTAAALAANNAKGEANFDEAHPGLSKPKGKKKGK